MPLDQGPVNRVREKRVDMLVYGRCIRAAQIHFVPISHSRHQLNAQEIGESKNGLCLALGVGMDGIGLNGGIVLEQPVQNKDRFPDTAGNDMREQRYIGI